MARPRKITIHGSDGLIYMFLGKPKDDLRKDARLMDFNSIINKLLKTNSDARRRQLHIRTYGVVTLNEECGFIQWVPNTIPIRHVLMTHYENRRLRPWNQELAGVFEKIKVVKSDNEIVDLFQNKVLSQFPPVFHEWFVETFPEPSAWLASRLSFARTAAVMSMVGYILGLGDRHGENILLDLNTGDIIHVDFNCLFEKVLEVILHSTADMLTCCLVNRESISKPRNEYPSGLPRTSSTGWVSLGLKECLGSLAKSRWGF